MTLSEFGCFQENEQKLQNEEKWPEGHCGCSGHTHTLSDDTLLLPDGDNPSEPKAARTRSNRTGPGPDPDTTGQ